MPLLDVPSPLGPPCSLGRWFPLAHPATLPVDQRQEGTNECRLGFCEQLGFSSGLSCPPPGNAGCGGVEESVWLPLLASFSLGSLLN